MPSPSEEIIRKIHIGADETGIYCNYVFTFLTNLTPEEFQSLQIKFYAIANASLEENSSNDPKKLVRIITTQELPLNPVHTQEIRVTTYAFQYFFNALADFKIIPTPEVATIIELIQQHNTEAAHSASSSRRVSIDSSAASLASTMTHVTSPVRSSPVVPRSPKSPSPPTSPELLTTDSPMSPVALSSINIDI